MQCPIAFEPYKIIPMEKVRCHHNIRRGLILVSFVSTLFSCNNLSFNSYAFRYPAKSDHTEHVYYDDSLFDKDSSVYREDLASASIAFAMASFASGEQKNINALTRYNNIKDLLEKTGFTDFATNPDYKKRSERDTIGLVFAHKQIRGKTLIYTGIRGANYEMEWASNLSIADPNKEYDPLTANPYHYGFYTAATQLISDLKDYISTTAISGDIMLWTSGYSRAGATANIAGGLLDQAIEKGEKPLGSKVNLQKSDLYVYCFEPPMGAPVDVDSEGKLLARKENYNNIFCHVNFNDPVPLVAMKEVGYTRFGIDRYFPDPISYVGYESYLADVASMFKGLPSFIERGGNFALLDFGLYTIEGVKLVEDKNAPTWTQGLFVREFVSAFTKFGVGAIDSEHVAEAKQGFFDYIQPAARTAFQVIYETGAFKGSLIDLGTSMISDVLSVPEDADMLLRDLTNRSQLPYFYDDLTYVLKKGMTKLGIDFSGDALKKDLKKFVQILSSFITYVFTEVQYYPLITTWFHLDNAKSIGFGHYPELCLSAVRCLDKNYISAPMQNTNYAGKYFTITFDDVNAEVTVDKGSDTLLDIDGGQFVTATIPARKTTNGVEVVLPYGEEYRVSFNSSSKPEVTLFDYTYRANDIDYPVSFTNANSFNLK